MENTTKSTAVDRHKPLYSREDIERAEQAHTIVEALDGLYKQYVSSILSKDLQIWDDMHPPKDAIDLGKVIKDLKDANDAVNDFFKLTSPIPHSYLPLVMYALSRPDCRKFNYFKICNDYHGQRIGDIMQKLNGLPAHAINKAIGNFFSKFEIKPPKP